MNESVFEGHGIEIVRRAAHLFIRYDAGELVVQMKEVEVSAEQARRAQQGEREAYEVILQTQRTES